MNSDSIESVSNGPQFQLTPGYYAAYLNRHGSPPGPGVSPDAIVHGGAGTPPVSQAGWEHFNVTECWWSTVNLEAHMVEGISYRRLCAQPTLPPGYGDHQFRLIKDVLFRPVAPTESGPDEKPGLRPGELFPGDYQVFANTGQLNGDKYWVTVPSAIEVVPDTQYKITKFWFVKSGQVLPQASFDGVMYLRRGDAGTQIPVGYDAQYEVVENLTKDADTSGCPTLAPEA